MKISELAAAADVPLATVKFYLREGLLMPGTPVTRTRSEYGPAHVARIRLVRTLAQQAGFTHQLIGRILTLVDADDRPAADRVAEAMEQLPPGPRPVGDLPHVRALADELGIDADGSTAVLSQLEAALDAADDVGLACSPERLRMYWSHLRPLADSEVAGLAGETSDAAAIQHAVVGTAIYEPVLLALRRLAHQQAYRDRAKPAQ